eukprot:TRINITY_DN18778_c0_g1_i1.p1 TRINITY_DN18778_c0_g1~~TRINITY_DN18778_c0_g1_i1.p1  ORF type:complete len:449 (+),score=23.81 TRINITY_DN18778_c0_g1_i1:49-1395(+)
MSRGLLIYLGLCLLANADQYFGLPAIDRGTRISFDFVTNETVFAFSISQRGGEAVHLRWDTILAPVNQSLLRFRDATGVWRPEKTVSVNCAFSPDVVNSVDIFLNYSYHWDLHVNRIFCADYEFHLYTPTWTWHDKEHYFITRDVEVLTLVVGPTTTTTTTTTTGAIEFWLVQEVHYLEDRSTGLERHASVNAIVEAVSGAASCRPYFSGGWWTLDVYFQAFCRNGSIEQHFFSDTNCSVPMNDTSSIDNILKLYGDTTVRLLGRALYRFGGWSSLGFDSLAPSVFNRWFNTSVTCVQDVMEFPLLRLDFFFDSSCAASLPVHGFSGGWYSRTVVAVNKCVNHQRGAFEHIFTPGAITLRHFVGATGCSGIADVRQVLQVGKCAEIPIKHPDGVRWFYRASYNKAFDDTKEDSSPDWRDGEDASAAFGVGQILRRAMVVVAMAHWWCA